MKLVCEKTQLYSTVYGEKTFGQKFEVDEKTGRQLVSDGFARQLTSSEFDTSAIQPVDAAPSARASKVR